ncbi:MAG: sulfatase [Rikenella sp.]|nr:sulfatase [Rikenella sp.]
MNKSLLLVPVGLSVCGTTLQAKNKKSAETCDKPLNIIYIMTDDHSFQTISCYDGRYNQTPNLDRLAREGVRFDNSFVTNSISGPSRAVMITGKHSHKNGFLKNEGGVPFDGTQQTFPKLLQQRGYQTALIGKWHLISNPTGFDHWEILQGQGYYYNPDFITPEGTHREHGYVTNLITDKGIDYLEHRDRSKPFCLLLHHKAVHRIWMSDTCNLTQFEDRTFPVPETFWDDYAGRPAAADQEMSIDKDMDLAYDLKMIDSTIETRLKGGIMYGELGRMTPEQRAQWDSAYQPLIDRFIASGLSGKELAEWKFQRYMRDYLKSVKSLDDNIGRLMDYLEREGLLENTLVVYASDQGFYMGEHGWFDKRFMYEESLRTPLLMRLPDCWKHAERGREIGQMVQNIDYAPTFLDLAGVTVPEDIQGVSLVPLLRGEQPKEWRDAIYYHYFEFPGEHRVRRHYGVRTDRYKLIHFYGDDIDMWELYDLKTDPSELHNRYDDPKLAKVQAKMHEKLVQLREQYDDRTE